MNDCPSLTKVYAPMTVSFQSWYGNPAFCAVNLSELHICVDTYGCPSYSLVISTSTSIHKGYDLYMLTYRTMTILCPRADGAI